MNMRLYVIISNSIAAFRREVNEFAEKHDVQWHLCQFQTQIVSESAHQEGGTRYTAFIVYEMGS